MSRKLHLPVDSISERRQEKKPFRTIKDALWARYGKDFGRMLDQITNLAK